MGYTVITCYNLQTKWMWENHLYIDELFSTSMLNNDTGRIN
jgi:hypothetical protein